MATTSPGAVKDDADALFKARAIGLREYSKFST